MQDKDKDKPDQGDKSDKPKNQASKSPAKSEIVSKTSDKLSKDKSTINATPEESSMKKKGMFDNKHMFEIQEFKNTTGKYDFLDSGDSSKHSGEEKNVSSHDKEDKDEPTKKPRKKKADPGDGDDSPGSGAEYEEGDSKDKKELSNPDDVS